MSIAERTLHAHQTLVSDRPESRIPLFRRIGDTFIASYTQPPDTSLEVSPMTQRLVFNGPRFYGLENEGNFIWLLPEDFQKYHLHMLA